MPLLIDGYNLLHVTGIFGEGADQTALARSRQALLEFLAAAIEPKLRAQTTIVFDAAGAPPGLPPTLPFQGMSVHFARGYPDADAMIEELLEEYRAPKSLLVVSSDHRVQRAARRRGARWVDSAPWYSELLAARRARGATGEELPAKPVGQPTSDEVAYWLGQFTLPPALDAAQAADQDAPAEKTTKRPKRKKSKRRPADDLENPFPPGYAEDLLDEAPE